jgi:hypothetical protein
MTSKLDELDRLASLRDRGVLSEAEFAQAKAEVLAGMPRADLDINPAVEAPGDSTTGEEAGADSDISIWEIFRPIETAHQAHRLLAAGYYAATAITVQGVIFLSRTPVVSDDDNVVLIAVLVILVAIAFLAARSVSKGANRFAAWVLLIIAGCQAFGTATDGRWDWLMIALALAGVALSIQSVRAASAGRRLTSLSNLDVPPPTSRNA